MKPFEALGRRACEFAESTRENLAFLGETTACALGILVHPGRFRLRDAALAFERASFDALPVTTGIGFLLGLFSRLRSSASLGLSSRPSSSPAARGARLPPRLAR